MKVGERDSAMQAFGDGTAQLLVATTVVEVGVDVPEASIIIIEHAERFGLAQLTTRRVGRSDQQSSRLNLLWRIKRTAANGLVSCATRMTVLSLPKKIWNCAGRVNFVASIRHARFCTCRPCGASRLLTLARNEAGWMLEQSDQNHINLLLSLF